MDEFYNQRQYKAFICNGQGHGCKKYVKLNGKDPVQLKEIKYVSKFRFLWIPEGCTEI